MCVHKDFLTNKLVAATWTLCFQFLVSYLLTVLSILFVDSNYESCSGVEPPRSKARKPNTE